MVIETLIRGVHSWLEVSDIGKVGRMSELLITVDAFKCPLYIERSRRGKESFLFPVMQTLFI